MIIGASERTGLGQGTSREAMIPRSVAVSSAEVASSQISSRGWRRKARAIATRCFSPARSASGSYGIKSGKKRKAWPT
jgi:hypothetical protein